MSFILLYSGCNKKWDDHYNTLDETYVKEKIISEMENIEEISMFTEVVKQNDELLDLLSQNRLYTVFAPVNNTFSQIDTEITGNVKLFERMIKYHFIDGKHKYKDFSSSEIITFNNKYVNVAIGSNEEPIIDNNATIIDPDYLSLNGMIQVIDLPLIPLNNLYENFQYNDYLLKFGESIGKYTIKVFDIEASTESSINDQGEIVYDSVFNYLNPFLYSGEEFIWEDFYGKDVLCKDISDEDLKFTAVVPNDIEAAITAASSSSFLNTPLPDEDLVAPLLTELIFSGELTKDELIAEIELCQASTDSDSSEVQLYFNELLQNNYVGEVELSNGRVHEVNSFEYDFGWLIKDQVNIDKNQSEEEYLMELMAATTMSENVDTLLITTGHLRTVFFGGRESPGQFSDAYGQWINFELEGDFYPVDYKVLIKGRNVYSGTYKVEIEGQEISQYNFAEMPSGDLETQFDEIGVVSFNEVKKTTNLKFTFIETHSDFGEATVQNLWIKEIKLEPIIE